MDGLSTVHRPSPSCDWLLTLVEKQKSSYHPDFGGVGDTAVLFKHPLVVGEQQLQAEPESEDEGEPEQRAEDQG